MNQAKRMGAWGQSAEFGQGGMDNRVVSIIVPAQCEGWRVAEVLRGPLGVSERQVRRAKSVEGSMRLDGRPVWSIEVVHAGQRLDFLISDTGMRRADTAIQPELGPLDLRYEDEDLLIVNKPANTVVHPSPGHDGGTLANFVRGYLLERGQTCNIHPVQRLDVGTSGLVVFATSGYVHKRLDDMMHTQDFVREYVALCHGLTPKAGTVDAPLARLTRAPSTFGVSPAGKPSVTHYWTEGQWWRDEDGQEISLVRLRLETGRTHQIRIHMAYLGFPLVGDVTYGGSAALAGRPLLHSREVQLTHPVTGERIEVQAPKPEDFCLYEQGGWSQV